MWSSWSACPVARAADAKLLVAAAGGRVLGTVTFVPDGGPLGQIAGPHEAEFRILAVEPSAHGRGVGTALLRRVRAAARLVAGAGGRAARVRARGLRRSVRHAVLRLGVLPADAARARAVPLVGRAAAAGDEDPARAARVLARGRPETLPAGCRSGRPASAASEWAPTTAFADASKCASRRVRRLLGVRSESPRRAAGDACLPREREP